LPLFYRETGKILSSLKESGIISTFEFIFVDDGFSDSTLSVLQNLAGKDSRVHYAALSRNFGKEAAMLAGLERSVGRYVVTMDVARNFRLMYRSHVDSVLSLPEHNRFSGRGIQLLSIGILGQYLAKTYTEVKQRPHYIVREEK